MKSTESTLQQSDGYVTTLEWRLVEEGKPVGQWIVTALGSSKKASRACAAKKMLEERGCVPSLSTQDRKRVNHILGSCKHASMNMCEINSAIQMLPVDARDMFLVDVFRASIAHNCIDKLVLPKQIGWKVWSQLIDEATFVVDHDVLSLLANVEVCGNFDPETSRKYYQKFRYLIASERRASLRQALEFKEDSDREKLEWYDLRVTDPATPYFGLQSDGALPDVGEGDILVVRAPSIERPFLCKVTAKSSSSSIPRITVKALRQEKLDFTEVSVANLDGEIPVMRQIEALDAFALPKDPFGPQRRFDFYPLIRDAILSLQERHTAGRIGVVHGPPGTGKTYTACAIVKSWLEEQPMILCVTDSNAAADNLHSALKSAGVRAVRFQKEPTEECKISRSYNAWFDTKDAYYRMKTWKDTLERYSVVVTTCASAGHPFLDSMVFDAMILDEATQSTEPSCLVPIGRGVQQCVLIGDPKQLPPTVYDTPELQVTLFDRVDKVEPEDSKIYLDEQRRMHPEIMAFPNQQFYHGRLKTNVVPPLPAGWPKGPRVIFKEISGSEASRGASKCNITEVQAVKAEVKRLRAASATQTIAVLTPYVSQRHHLKRALADFGVSVHTIDGYQGNEADVVLFSTVRSERLGFTDDSRRINVALTRAKGGLVVFGRRNVLETSSMWRNWVQWVDALRKSHTEESPKARRASDVRKETCVR